MAGAPDGSSRPGDVIGVPREFFERDLAQVRDLAELKVLLTVHRLVADTPELPFVPEQRLLDDEVLFAGLRLRGSARGPQDEIRQGIELALGHDRLLRFWLGDDRDAAAPADGSYWLTPAGPANRLKLAALQRGELVPPASMPRTGRVQLERPNIFRLYEQNIGLVTPLIADQLIEALEVYPEAWIGEAIDEAVGYNRRNWRYIQRILERWATEGRGDEADRRAGATAAILEPDKYLRGKYASLFRRR